jgi:hypothetical protein
MPGWTVPGLERDREQILDTFHLGTLSGTDSPGTRHARVRTVLVAS